MYYNLSECENDEVEIDFLFPNGFFYTSKFRKNLRLKELKSKLWNLISNVGNEFYFKLADSYYFSAISSDAKQCDFRDSDMKLSDLNLINWTFKVNEIEKNNSEQQDDAKLTYLTGFNTDELDEVKDVELIEYRIDMLKHVQSLIYKELNLSEIDLESHLFKTSYSPNLEINLENLSYSTESSLTEDECLTYFDLTIHDETDRSYKILNVSVNEKPTNIIREYFRLKFKDILNDNEFLDIVKDYENSYVLNVCGTNDIFYGNTEPIGNFKYIKKCLSLDKVPCFYLKTRKDLSKELTKPNLDLLNSINNTIDYLTKRLKTINKNVNLNRYVLTIDDSTNFRIFIEYIALLPKLFDCDKIFFKTALFVNTEPISQIIESDKYDITMINQDMKLPINVQQRFEFNIKIRQLPKSSKFCFCLFYTTKKKKSTYAFAFIGINLFDHQNFLVCGRKKLFMWSLESVSDSFESICRLHAIGSNPERNSSYIQLEFKNDEYIKFPDEDQFEKYACNFEYPKFEDLSHRRNSGLENIIRKDSLSESLNLERNFLWQYRKKCMEYPHSLVKLVKCVNWTDHSNVLEYYKILEHWPLLRPVDAILLLHSDVADSKTRSFGVKCLEKNMKNEEVEFYLLQLVQALKNEPYLKNDLSKFLLNRAVQSTKIGLKLFWILRTEVSDLKYRDQFRIILEAYCRKRGPHFNDLLDQVHMIDTLTNLSKFVKSSPDINFAAMKKSFLKEKLNEADFKRVLSNQKNPIDDSLILGKINPVECFLLSSAKRPLYLTWTNDQLFYEFYDSNFQLIFKNGDDLRQDMLTIQAFKLMDIIWKNENLDLKMLIYDVFTTGNKLGFIEIVKDSMTIYKILTEGGAKGKYQIDNYQLYKWICDNNPNEKLNLAIDNFSKSCAGFCVATFVLGIGDRHPSNIMITRDGKLFHIDFGHFLGHFKEKFGIKRERVPFVLTEHFTKVISKGAFDPLQTPEFIRFTSLCERAYMTLRRYSNLLIDLFVIMLSSGMPELKSTNDIMYLKSKLVPDLPDDKALEFFRNQFNESITFSFTTKFDWIFHALNHRAD